MNVDELDMEDLATVYVLFLEGKMDGILGFSVEDLEEYSHSDSYPEVGEGGVPTKALLYKRGSLSLISGRSSDLNQRGFVPFPDSHFNTQYALAVTQALATFHATLKVQGVKSLCSYCPNENVNKPYENYSENTRRVFADSFSKEGKDIPTLNMEEKDHWTCQVSQPSLVAANLSILQAHFRHAGVSSRITDKLESLQRDVLTLTQFLRFAAAMQSESRMQSIGPVGMSDIWVPRDSRDEENSDTLIIRLKGGPHLMAPPLRDTAWVWLTLLHPEVLQERYMELCESYCTSFNSTLTRLNPHTQVVELTLFDIMRDLGESFLHGFITMVHKFMISGVWALDRQLHTREGLLYLAEAVGFLVDNGIIGSIFIV